MQAQDVLSFDVLAIVPDNSPFEQIRKMAEEQEFQIQHQTAFKEGEATLKREGYRYRIVLLDVNTDQDTIDWVSGIADKYFWIHFVLFTSLMKPVQKHVSQQPKDTVLTSRENVSINLNEGISDLSVIAGNVLEMLNNARSNLASLPNPPYQAGETHFLKEIGPLLFSVSRTDRPWALEGDVFTLPVGSVSGTFGALGVAWQQELGPTEGEELLKRVQDRISREKHGPATPIYESFTYAESEDSIPETKALILATAGGTETPSMLSAIKASVAAIVLATSLKGCKTLVLPVIGGGNYGFSSAEVIPGVLKELDPSIEHGELKHVIFTVYEQEVFDSLSQQREEKIELVQKLENDIPSGPDRLSVESEVNALADAIALNEMSPPMVVGILGGWGTGKSFVLHLLKERLRQIRCWDLSEEKVRSGFPYVGHPYIVHFDAWTYAKSDLWASLMQRILLDLDRQLSLEKTLDEANSGLLLRGLDIWNLLDGLNDKQLESLETDMGAQAISTFKTWKKGENVAETLWSVLGKLRKDEIDCLNDARKKLENAEAEHARHIDELTRQKSYDAIRHNRELEQKLEKIRNEVKVKTDLLVSRLEAEKAAVIANTEQEINNEARHAAWEPVVDLLVDRYGSVINKIIKTSVADSGGAPVSIYSVTREIGITTRYFRGLLSTSSGLALLVFSGVALSLPLVGEYINLSGQLANYLGSIGGPTGLMASAYTVLTKVNNELDAQQKQYDERINKCRQERELRYQHRLKEEQNKTVAPIEVELQELINKNKKQCEITEQEARLKIDKRLNESLNKLEEVTKKGETEIQALKAEVEKYQRRAGMVGRGQSLFDVVRERRENKYYEDKLGLLHQVQDDLREVSDALMPIGGSDKALFPRGDPRIILLIDDLDRCTPDKVVQMLEAAQLLVKTRLFVVVIAMDVRYVTRALEKEYAGILVRDGEPSGLDYIEKIVQIPYRVPGIVPGVMRSFLQGQMKGILQDTEVEKEEVKVEAGEDNQILTVDEEAEGNPVFESSYDPDAIEVIEPLPTQVQLFNEIELSLLADCCNAVSVSPRAGRRLVNVFKLLKIIWYHRGMQREPEAGVKRVMMFLLALSSVQPVIMRQVLHFLEEEYRKENLGGNFKVVFQACIDRSRLGEDHAQAKRMLKDLVSMPGNIPELLTLETIQLDNLRLVKSFSFVGEVTHDEVSVEENLLKSDKNLKFQTRAGSDSSTKKKTATKNRMK